MARLSIIIVNYNVKYFLEHALYAVRKAARDISCEIFVVDNDSSDGSVEMLQEKFPEVTLIANKNNVGFAAANNQAIRASNGEFVLLLNPDTVVEEDTFQKCLSFFDAHPEAGALGVKMVDGKGSFLPESKRGLPTPAVAFYKIFGLSKLFPRSQTFGRYHLGYLNEDEIHEVDILAGAYMMMRKEALDKAGLLDETFFMYGEDIDLSYRIQQSGYKNYYFPKTRIIHYKGESTKKGSLNYIRMFYQAMIIFARKHFSPGKASFFSILINIAIFFRAFLTLISNLVKRAALPFLDAVLAFAGMYFITQFWATNIKDIPEYYPPEFLSVIVPVYIFIWIFVSYFMGAYDRPVRLLKIFRGIVFGTLIIAAGYGFLPEHLRFSRALILLGAAWATISMIINRVIFNLLRYKKLAIEEVFNHKVLIVGEVAEAKRTLSLMKQAGIDSNVIGFVLPGNGTENNSGEFLGRTNELQDLVEVYQADELIFCAKDVNSSEIIHWMTRLGSDIDYKIVPEESFSIIGSNSKNTSGDLYAIDINLKIDTSLARRNKRVFDLISSILLLPILPVLLFLVKSPWKMLKNWFHVFSGKCSWVGYEKRGNSGHIKLPEIRRGILSPLDGLRRKEVSDETAARLNFLYAKDYSILSDWQIFRRGLKKIGA